MSTMRRIGLLGCGNIGNIIVTHRAGLQIVSLYDIIPNRAYELSLVCGARVHEDFNTFVADTIDLVVEAASVQAVREFAIPVLREGKDLVVLSVGALSDSSFYQAVEQTARDHACRVYIPSGAIAGLDNAKVGRFARIDRLLLKTTKSPQSLGIAAEERRLVFKGKANECIKEFPRNVNVSVALSLAAGKEVDVELWADPSADRIVHEIQIEGEFGEISVCVRNLPSPDNPATSYLAALSILTLLHSLEDPIVVGT